MGPAAVQRGFFVHADTLGAPMSCARRAPIEIRREHCAVRSRECVSSKGHFHEIAHLERKADPLEPRRGLVAADRKTPVCLWDAKESLWNTSRRGFDAVPGKSVLAG